MGEVGVTILLNGNHIFDPDATPVRNIHPGFDRNDLAGLQHFPGLRSQER